MLDLSDTLDQDLIDIIAENSLNDVEDAPVIDEGESPLKKARNSDEVKIIDRPKNLRVKRAREVKKVYAEEVPKNRKRKSTGSLPKAKRVALDNRSITRSMTKKKKTK